MVFRMRFHVPAAFHELHGQPVEQLRMHRPLALRAEILHGLHQARCRNTSARSDSRSRARSADSTDPPASAPGPAGCSASPARIGGRTAGHARRDLFRRGRRLSAALQDEGVARRGAVLHHHDGRNRCVEFSRVFARPAFRRGRLIFWGRTGRGNRTSLSCCALRPGRPHCRDLRDVRQRQHRRPVPATARACKPARRRSGP